MRSPSASLADPQKRRARPLCPPKARTRRSRPVAARNVTAALSPDTWSLSMKILRPGTGSGGWNSISGDVQPPSGSCSSATAVPGTATTSRARTDNPTRALRNLPRFRRRGFFFPPWPAARRPLTFSLAVFSADACRTSRADGRASVHLAVCGFSASCGARALP